MRRALAVVMATAALTLVPAQAASAHPLGNFTVNTADRLVVDADGLTVVHVVDLAEIPSVQLAQRRAGVDADDDGRLSPSELTAHAQRECGRTGRLLTVHMDGVAVRLATTGAEATSSPGTAGLATTRITCTYDAGARLGGLVRFEDPVARERNGWREVTATSACGPLDGPNVPQDSPSGLLRDYPEDLLQAPLDVTSASFSVRTGTSCAAARSAADGVAEEAVPARGLDRLSQVFTDFLARPDLTVPFAVLSVVAATLFGVLHSLAPGHGKTVMAAYLVGQRGTRRQALQLGALVTFTHTASVLLLGAALAVGALAAPELAVPVAEVLSGALLAAVGGYLVLLAVRRLTEHRRGRGGHGEHGPGEDHHHGDHGHEHGHGHGHGHLPEDAQDEITSGSAFPEANGAVAVASRPATHTHGGQTHTHQPLPEGRLSWKGLLGMGVAGGLVPSPSALLVLLSATALGRAWFGVVLVLAYGLGMAVTLTVAGLLLLRARALLERRGWALGRRLGVVRLLPLGTAALVVVVGLTLVLRGVSGGNGLL